MFEVCIAISVKWRWPRVTLISPSAPRLPRYEGVDFRVVFDYPSALLGPYANNATSDTQNSQCTFQWHCPSLFRSDGAPQHDWFTRWKKLCLCPLRLAISQVLDWLRPRNLIQSASTWNGDSESKMSAKGDALLKELWAVKNLQWLNY